MKYMTFEGLMIESSIYALCVLKKEREKGISKTKFYQNGRIVNEKELEDMIIKYWELLNLKMK